MHIDKIEIKIMAMSFKEFRKEDIEAACISAALCLGYNNLKDEQKSVITNFVSGSVYFPLGLEKVFVTPVFLECSIACQEWPILYW